MKEMIRNMRLAPFTSDHIDQAVMLSQAEKWPHRREDWDMLLDLSTGRVALEGDKVVGTTLRTDYGPEVSMMNMIIVGASHRGRGLGRRLMESMMEEVPGRELRLFATSDGLPLYEKLGFVAEGAISQCQGQITRARKPVTPVSRPGLTTWKTSSRWTGTNCRRIGAGCCAGWRRTPSWP